MPIAAVFLGSILIAIVEFLAKFITKRLAMVAAVIVMATTLTGAFVAAMKALISALVVAIPAPVVIGASWVWPSNANACIAAILAAHVLRWVYDWNVKVIQYKLI